MSLPEKKTLRWRHNDHAGVSNHQPHGCLLNRLFRRRSKKTSKLRVTGLCVGNSSGPVNSPHKGPVTRKMFPFDDVIMLWKPTAVTTPTPKFQQYREGMAPTSRKWHLDSRLIQRSALYRGQYYPKSSQASHHSSRVRMKCGCLLWV